MKLAGVLYYYYYFLIKDTNDYHDSWRGFLSWLLIVSNFTSKVFLIAPTTSMKKRVVRIKKDMYFTFKPTTLKVYLVELIIFSIIVCYFILDISFFFLDRLYAINHSKSSNSSSCREDGSNTCTVVVVALLDCLSQEIWVLFSYWHLARASLGPKTPLKHEKRG